MVEPEGGVDVWLGLEVVAVVAVAVVQLVQHRLIASLHKHAQPTFGKADVIVLYLTSYFLYNITQQKK